MKCFLLILLFSLSSLALGDPPGAIPLGLTRTQSLPNVPPSKAMPMMGGVQTLPKGPPSTKPVMMGGTIAFVPESAPFPSPALTAGAAAAASASGLTQRSSLTKGQIPASALQPSPALSSVNYKQEIRSHKSHKTGQFYEITHLKRFDNVQNKCDETIKIQGRSSTVTEAITDTFDLTCNPEPNAPKRFMAYHYNMVMAGGVEEGLLVYGHKDTPKLLLVIRNGNCEIRSYEARKVQETIGLRAEACKRAKELVIKVKQQGGKLIEDESMKDLNQLMYSAASSKRNAFKLKMKHWLRRLWIGIKNSGRKLVGRPTKDE